MYMHLKGKDDPSEALPPATMVLVCTFHCEDSMFSFAFVAVTVNKVLPVLPLLVAYNANDSILVNEFHNMKVTSITGYR
jgi:hypothetical protein